MAFVRCRKCRGGAPVGERARMARLRPEREAYGNMRLCVARSRDSGVYQRSAPSAFLREEITNGE